MTPARRGGNDGGGGGGGGDSPAPSLSLPGALPPHLHRPPPSPPPDSVMRAVEKINAGNPVFVREEEMQSRPGSMFFVCFS